MTKQDALIKLIVRHGHKAETWGQHHLMVASWHKTETRTYRQYVWVTEYIPATRSAVMAWLGY